MRILIACVLAYAVTYTLTPFSIGVAKKFGAVDIPRDWRRMHRKEVPRAGGIAILFGILTALVTLGYGNGNFDGGLALGYVGFVLLGFIDDVMSLGPRSKLLFQAGIVALTVWRNGAGDGWGAVAFFWVMILVNAHNMIDGLDGLLVGCVAIEGGALSVVLLLMGLPSGALSACTVMACLGFLPYNRHPAKTFAGDCGSESLGFLMGMLSIPLLQAPPLEVGALTPVFLFAYPLTDLIAAVLRRVLRGKSPFCADRGHLHHRVFDAGVDHAGCTALLLTIAGALCTIGVLLCDPRLWDAAAVACLLSTGLLVYLRRYILNFS